MSTGERWTKAKFKQCNQWQDRNDKKSRETMKVEEERKQGGVTRCAWGSRLENENESRAG